MFATNYYVFPWRKFSAATGLDQAEVFISTCIK